MIKLKIPMTSAMGLEAAIGQQGGKAGELRILFAALEKLEPAASLRKVFVKRLPNGQVDVDEDGLALVDDFEGEFESAEVDRMVEVLDSWQGFSTRDMKWVLPLRKQLRDALESEAKPAKKLARAV